MAFRRGDDVEVCGKEEGFEGSYYEAVVLAKITDNDYIVRYRTLKEEDGELLREVVHRKHLRPCPPEIRVGGFSNHDVIDAFHNDGWWVGEIKAITKSNIYVVYFPRTRDEFNYSLDCLRIHKDWVNYKWVSPKSYV